MNYFQFGLLSLVSGAANKIHTCCSAHSNASTFHTTARRFPGVVNQASSRERKGERGKRKKEELPSTPDLPPPALLLLAVIKENPSVISPPSHRSKPHDGRAAIMFKCPPSVRFVKQ